MTAAVVIGLLVEYIPDLKEKWEKFTESGGWKSLITRHSPAWKPLAVLLGAAIVTGGVGGEMIFEALSFHKEGQLEQDHANLDLYLQGEAGDAATSVKDAAVDANQAKTDAWEAKGEAQLAATAAGGARRTADEAEAHWAATLKRTARLEAELSWRTISPQQEKVLDDSLGRYRLSETFVFRDTNVTFESLTGDTKGTEYTNELIRALGNALDGSGAHINDFDVLWMSPGVVRTGVILQINSDQVAVGAADALRSALHNAGIETQGELTNDVSSETVNVFVGAKPPPIGAKQKVENSRQGRSQATKP